MLYVKIVDKVDKALKALVIAVFAIMFCLAFLQVILRFIFSSSLGWSQDVTIYLMAFLVYLSAGLVAREGKFIRLEVLLMFLKNQKLKLALNVIADLFNVVFFVFAGYGTLLIMQSSLHNYTQSISWLSWAVPYSAIPIGSVLVILNIIAFRIAGPTKKPADESQEVRSEAEELLEEFQN